MFEESIRNGTERKLYYRDIPFVAGFTSEEGLVSKKERERERVGERRTVWERVGERRR